MEVLNFKPINKNSLLATFSLKIPKWGNIILRDMTLFQKGSHRWIGFPSRQYEEAGQKKYFSYMQFEDKQTKEVFDKKVLEVLETYIAALPKEPEFKQLDAFEQTEVEPLPF